jgi:MoaA/NifB/PqqE/SkfB family radical SAM enzyme
VKPKAQDHWRLTWNPVAPAKYESAWSIFVKVMYHNYLHPIELADLIKKDGFAKRRINIFYATDSQWIDFEKFGSLLGVAPARLKTGFLDQRY